MIVTLETLTDDIAFEDFVTAADHCWHCGRPLTLPCVMWHGESSLWLHRECAMSLADKLICDAIKLPKVNP